MSHSDTYLMALLLALPFAASRGEADMVSARAIRAANGSFNFGVTIRSQDRRWDHYADRFAILAPDGTVLGVRQLAHPHVDEQPFPRELDGCWSPTRLIPSSYLPTTTPRGYDDATVQVELPR